jgi:hypothetical protein
MSPPAFKQTNFLSAAQRNARLDYSLCYLDRGGGRPGIVPSDPQRENENAHANTAAFKGFDPSIRATPKIAMTERSTAQNGYLKPDTQSPKHPPPPTDEGILDRSKIAVQYESFFECRLTLSVLLSAGNLVPGTVLRQGQTKAL